MSCDFPFAVVFAMCTNKGKSKGLLNLNNSSSSIVAAHGCKYISRKLYTGIFM